METRTFDVAVIGGSLGGVQAARVAAAHGLKVYMCESTDWIGGQLTSQAVPPDEHPWIEQQGAPKSYLEYRTAVRSAYRHDPAASSLMREQEIFCPGNSWVSRLAHDPRLALQLLTESIAPYVAAGLLVVETKTHCVEAEVSGDRILSVIIEKKQGLRERICAEYFLDATDMGDLLPLTGTAYRIGAESINETGEPDAPEVGDALDHQPITWVAALEMTKERHEMPRPDGYSDWKEAIVLGTKLLGWDAWSVDGLTRFAMFDNQPGASPLGLWSYRRIVYPPYYTDNRSEITLLNWPQNDYSFGNIIDDPLADRHLEEARELTRCCAYWLWEQGYPIRMIGDVTGTADGLAKAPYIRESRRIVAQKNVLEQELLTPHGAQYADSIGVGHYHIDLHMTTRSKSMMYKNVQPFEIPLSAMISVNRSNLIPAAKNIGTTHLTSGCFRLHPVEWTIGEAAGHLAAFCILRGITPTDVASHHVTEFQEMLTRHGFMLHWNLKGEGEM